METPFSRPRDPRKIPEHILWTLTRAREVAEARTRMVPLGPELRIYVSSQGTGKLELLWSRVFGPQDGGGAALGELASQKRDGFYAQGWTDANPLPTAASMRPSSDEQPALPRGAATGLVRQGRDDA